MRNPLFIGQANSCLLFQLPFDVLEDITEHLSRRDLCSLMLASRECSSLATRALYSNIPLHNTSTDCNDLRAYHNLRRRQFSFLVAISQHPTYTRFIRRIAFEFTEQDDEPSSYEYPISAELVWRTFAKCLGVVYVDLKAARPAQARIEDPKAVMFPALRRARVEGPFSAETLSKLLNTSSSIKALELSINTPGSRRSPERVQDPLFRSIPNAGPFDELQGKNPSLRTLNIQIHPWVSLTSLGAFLQGTRKHVTLLILGLSVSHTHRGGDGNDVVWTRWVAESLKGFTVLEEVWLQGITPDDALGMRLKDSCPCLKSVRYRTRTSSKLADPENGANVDI